MWRAFGLIILAGCLSEAPQPPNTEPPPTDDCPDGLRMRAEGCVPRYADRGCPPNTTARLGTDECVPVGKTSCGAGFVRDASGWGCDPVLPPEVCPPGSMQRLGSSECQPVGWTDCSPPFETAASGWGCAAIARDTPCDGASRAAMGSRTCLGFGDCSAPLPAGAIIVDGTSIQAALDAAPAGAVIGIEPGTYSEALVVRSDVTVVGRCAESVIIDGTGLAAEGFNARAHTAVLRGVTLRGHTAGLRVDDDGELTASEVLVQEARGFGAITTGLLRLSASAIRDTRITADRRFGRGVQVFAGGRAELSEVELSRNVDAGVYVGDRWSSAELDRVVILDTRANGLSGNGVHANEASSIIVRKSLIVRSALAGVLATLGSHIALEEVVARDGIGGPQPGANGVVSWLGSTIEADRVQLQNGLESSALVEDRNSLLKLNNSVVTGTRQVASVFGGGLLVGPNGRAEVTATALVGNPDFGAMFVESTGSFQGSRVGQSTAAEPFGVLLWDSSAVSIEDSEVSESFGMQITRTSSATFRGSVMRDGWLSVLEGSRLEVVDSALMNGRNNGISAEDADTFVRVRGTSIHGTRIDDLDRRGEAMLLIEGASALVEDCDFANNQNRTVTVGAGSRLEVERTVLRHAIPDLAEGQGFGAGAEGVFVARDTAFLENDTFGIGTYEGGDVTVERSLFLRNQVTGILGANDTVVRIIDSTFEQQTQHDGEDEFGFGALLGVGEVEGSLFRDNQNVGLMFNPARGAVSNGTVRGCVVEGTKPDSTGFGHGIFAAHVEMIRIEDTFVLDNQSVGLAFADATAVVSSSLVAGNQVGTMALLGSNLIEAEGSTTTVGALEVLVSSDTRFVDNETKVGIGEIPIPGGVFE